MRNKLVTIGLLFCALSVSAATWMSPVDTDWLGNSLCLTLEDAEAIMLLDSETLEVSKRIELPTKPSATAVSNDGRTLYVTGGGVRGRVFVVEAASGKLEHTIDVGHSPTAPVLSPDGSRLYVCNQFSSDVSIIDLTEGKETQRIPLVREPVAADLSKDGRQLFVANLIPAGRADIDYVAAVVSVVDTDTGETSEIPLVNGAVGLYGLKVSPDGNFVFVTHMVARHQVSTTQLERGWVATNALSIIRVADKKLLYTALLDDPNLGFANAWAIDFSDDGKQIIVSAAGGHELSVIELQPMFEKIAKQANADNDLGFLSGIRARIQLQGKGPRSMAIKGSTAYVTHYFTDSIELVNLKAGTTHATTHVELNKGFTMTEARKGELFFHDASLCFQKWLSCLSCHPGIRADGFNWDLLNDGFGNPKNTKSMLYAHRTPPTTWLGVRANAEVSVRAGFEHIQFMVRPEEDAKAIDAFLKSLRPTPSPHLVNGGLSKLAQHGKRVFNAARCVHCHKGPLYTDGKQHEVGTTKGMDAGRPVDTPSLIELWRTAPYLHDGRAATVREVLESEDHGAISERLEHLSPKDITALEAFLLSL
ncbi:cell surface protein [Coraliomargarita akajimensis]|nr:cell surface protein [Coraliomargarita akajimensis]